MIALSSEADFDGALAVARRLFAAEQLLGDSNRRRNRVLKGDGITTWVGPARDVFDRVTGLTDERLSQAEAQVNENHRQLLELWAHSVDEHNRAGYDNAILQARQFLSTKQQQSLLHDAGVSASHFDWWQVQPAELVPRLNGRTDTPSAPDFVGGSVFAHFIRRYPAEFQIEIYWSHRPDWSALRCQAG